MRGDRLHRFREQIIILLALFFIYNNAWAHGVVYETKEDRAVIIKVAYDDGQPLSYAEVKIFSPDNKDIEYQNGRTDKNGCFAFLPDRAGKWKIIVDDGMGHGVSEEIEVKETMKIKETTKGWPRWQKLITGISIIWGLTGLILYLRIRRRMI